jgi:hypothetical protein
MRQSVKEQFSTAFGTVKTGLGVTAANLWEGVVDAAKPPGLRKNIALTGLTHTAKGLLKAGLLDPLGNIPQVLAAHDANEDLVKAGLPAVFPPKTTPLQNALSVIPFMQPVIQIVAAKHAEFTKAAGPKEQGVGSAMFRGPAAVLAGGQELVKSLLEVPLTGQIPDINAPGGYRQATPEETWEAMGNIVALKKGIGKLVPKLPLSLVPSTKEIMEGGRTIVGAAKAFRDHPTIGETAAAEELARNKVERAGLKVGAVEPIGNAPQAGGTTLSAEVSDRLGKNAGGEFPQMGDADALVGALDEGFQSYFSQKAVLDNDTFAAVKSQVLADPIKRKVLRSLVEKGDNINTATARIMADPALTRLVFPEILRNNTHHTDAELQEAFGAAAENTGHLAGTELAELSAIERAFQDRTLIASNSPDFNTRIAGQQQLADIRAIYEAKRNFAESSGTTVKDAWQALVKGGQGATRIINAYMLSGYNTASNIFKGQGVTGMLNLFDDLNTGLLSTIRNTVVEGRPEFRKSFVDLTSDLFSLANAVLHPTQVKAKEYLLNAPSVYNKVNTDLMAETHTRLGFFAGNVAAGGRDIRKAGIQAWLAQPAGSSLDVKAQAAYNAAGPRAGEVWKALREGGAFDPKDKLQFAEDVMMVPADLATIPLRLQESWYRVMFFGGRNRANLSKIGVTPEEGIRLMKEAGTVDAAGNPVRRAAITKEGYVWDDPKVGERIARVPEGVRQSNIDALDHSLRSTWAQTPDGGLLGMMLKSQTAFNRLSPVQTGEFLTRFPRAMANSVMWLADHDPTQLVSLFKPEYRDAFLGIGKHMDPVWEAEGRLSVAQTALEKLLKDPKPNKTSVRVAQGKVRQLETEYKNTQDLALLESARVQRQVGKALTGLFGVMGGLYLAEGGQVGSVKMGSKPWMVTTGETYDDVNGHPVYVENDLSSREPQLAAFLTLGALVKEGLGGANYNLSAGELARIFANTRIEDAQVFHLMDAWRGATKPDGGAGEVWEVIKDAGASDIATFGNILRNPLTESWKMGKEVMNLVETGSTPRGVAPSLAGKDFFDPLKAKVNPGGMLTHYDKFTGEVVGTPTALERNVFTETRVTPFESLMLRTPGYAPNMTTAPMVAPMAQELVNKYTGLILEGKNLPDMGSPILIDGKTLQQQAGELVNSQNPYKSNFFLQVMLPVIQNAAFKLAMAEDARNAGTSVPPSFKAELAKGKEDYGLPELRRLWQEAISKAYLVEKALPGFQAPDSTPQGTPVR